ncbi:MAG: hypothetical protein H6Q68_721 [Firmicutes bacterium]|nr:hypothetical protein [Bacillota bacterium]
MSIHCYKEYESDCSDVRPIVIATSLAASKDLNNQRMAINSWQKLGFSVVSINCSEEIALLQHHFSDISFVEAHRDARSEFNRPYIYFDDFLTYFTEHGTGVCGIVNSDIHLLNDTLYSFVKREAINSLVYGSRINVDTLDNLQGEDDPFGLDYFFFDRNLISYYPKSEFCIGLPYWDYWIVLIPLIYRIPAKRVMNAGAYHIKHQETWRQLHDLFEGKLMEKFSSLTGKACPIQFIDFICRHSREVSLDTQDTPPVSEVNQDIDV